MAILEIICFDKTSVSGSRGKHVLVSLRSEIISVRVEFEVVRGKLLASMRERLEGE